MRCRECGLPCEVTDTFVLASTSGPVLHAVTSCEQRHHLTVRIGA